MSVAACEVFAIKYAERDARRPADSPAHIVPGHAPLVLQRYPAASPQLESIAVRLDDEPARD